MNTKKILLIGLTVIATNIFAQDPNFYIYLCFGQSNMEGQGTIEEQDKTVDSRFKVMEAVNCSNLGRAKGSWYTATPPLCRCYSGLSPADYFGRFMVENLPDSITVGVINVSVAGCKIELFDKSGYQDYVSSVTESWLRNIINAYDGNPYAYMVDVAKLAQQDGIIKGILLHQGESNTGDSQWPSKVKNIYDSLIVDLSLPDTIPLLAGEVVNADQGGVCSSMNSIISTLPSTIPNSYIISSSGCTDASDNLHFNSAGYRKIGIRYAIQMLSLLGYEVEEPEEPVTREGTEEIYLEPECDTTMGTNWEIISDSNVSDGNYVTVKAGIESLSEAAGDEGLISLPFSIDTSGTFNLYARINCPSADDDSYWIKMDGGDFTMVNGVGTSGWQWVNFNSYTLTAGEHTFYITYREDGAKLDKICISNYSTSPEDFGNEAINACNGGTSSIETDLRKTTDGYALWQNYPNPVFDKTNISFEIPNSTNVSLKIHNILGEEVAILAEKKFEIGKHIIEFVPGNLPNGNYFYSIKTDDFSATRMMIVNTVVHN
jgi:hypothetical protein